MARRTVLNLLLAVVLLLAQQLAAAHALSHHDEGGVPEHVCELCVAAAQLASGLPSAAPVLTAAPAAIAPQTATPSIRARTPHLAYRSRAPPSLLS